MRVLKNLFGGLWLVFIAIAYFNTHTYDLIRSQLASWIIWLVFAWFVVIFSAWAYTKWIEKGALKLTALRLTLFMFVMAWATGFTAYLLLDPAILATPHQIVFYEGQQLAVIEEGVELTPGVNATLRQGSILNEWSNASRILPPELHELFLVKSAASFGFSLAKNIGILFAVWAFFFALFHNVGAWFWKKSSSFVLFKSIGAGMGVMMAGMFTLGALGQLKTGAVVGLTTLVLVAGLPKFPQLLKSAWKSSVNLSLKTIPWWQMSLAFIALLLLNFNILNTLGPFPFGFDSLTLYHNTPRLLTDYHHLLSGLAAYNMELLIAVPLFLFKSEGLGIALTQLGAFMGLAAWFILIGKRRSWKEALLAITLFLSLPMVNFMMTIDFKIDMPLLLFYALITEGFLEWWAAHDTPKSTRLLATLGLWLGMAFGIKYTVAIAIVTALAGIVYRKTGGWGFISMLLAGLGVIGLGWGLYPLAQFSSATQAVICASLAGIGTFGVLIVVLKKKVLATTIRALAISLGVMGLVLAPWFIKNSIEASSFSANSLLFGQRIVTADIESNQCAAPFSYDEFSQYLGYRSTSSLLKPFVVLWESTVTTGLPNNRLTDISFLFLGFLLFGILGWREGSKSDPSLKPIAMFTVGYTVLWWLTAKNLVWYGLPLLIGFLMLYRAVWRTEKWTYVVLGAWLIWALILRIELLNREHANLLYAGDVSDKWIRSEQAIHGVNSITDVVNQDKELNQKVYLVGKFIDYYIRQNNQRVHRDQYFADYTCTFQNDDPAVTLEKLRAQNFGFILVDYNQLSAESDPNGPLHQQFARFDQFAKEHLIQEVYRPGMRLYRVPK